MSERLDHDDSPAATAASEWAKKRLGQILIGRHEPRDVERAFAIGYAAREAVSSERNKHD